MGAPSRLQPVAIAGTGKIKLSILAKPDLPHEEECPTSRLNVASDLVFTLLESDQESKDSGGPLPYFYGSRYISLPRFVVPWAVPVAVGGNANQPLMMASILHCQTQLMFALSVRVT